MGGRTVKVTSIYLAAFVIVGSFATARAQAVHFTTGSAQAVLYGTHEIVLTGNGSVSNPFDTVATVRFTPPSNTENSATVDAFYDGGNTWRARVYVNEI